jgi:hypothetical protein
MAAIADDAREKIDQRRSWEPGGPGKFAPAACTIADNIASDVSAITSLDQDAFVETLPQNSMSDKA